MFIAIRATDRSVALYADENTRIQEYGGAVVLYSTNRADTTELLVVGKTTAVAFVRTSCASCVEHAGRISSIVSGFGAERALIVVADGTPGLGDEFANLPGVVAENVRIPADPLALPMLGLRAVPTFFVQDATGGHGWIGMPSRLELWFRGVSRVTRRLRTAE